MENRMQIFQNEEFGRVRTFVTEDGVPWFVGKDVADNLGYQNGSRDINRHVEPEDRTKGMVFDGNQRKETILINESGLYSLILSSKLESAKRFKHWVTGEVLPSIRRHGAYMTDVLLEQAAGNADVAAQVVRALSEERNLNKKLAGQLKQAEAQLTVALPKAAYFDALVDCPDCTGIRLTAKELGVSQSMFTAYGDTPFGLLVRKIAKLDHEAAMQAFSDFINDQSLNQNQIAFVNKIVNYIEVNGYMENVTELTKPPFDKPISFMRLFDVKARTALVGTINRVRDNAVRIEAS